MSKMIFVNLPVRDLAASTAFYVALGMGMDGKRDVLGLWVAQSEGAKGWLEIFTELKNRGINDILFLCADGLPGLSCDLWAPGVAALSKHSASPNGRSPTNYGTSWSLSR